MLHKNDKSLEYYKEINKKYGSEDFLVISYTPKSGKLFNHKTLKEIDILSGNLKKVPNVKNENILNVPLINSSDDSILSYREEVPTFKNSEVKLKDAKEEFTNSVLYQNLLVSKDGKTTAIYIELSANATSQNENLLKLQKNKNELNEKIKSEVKNKTKNKNQNKIDRAKLNKLKKE